MQLKLYDLCNSSYVCLQASCMMESLKLQMQLGKSQAVLKSCATGTDPVQKLNTKIDLLSPLYTPQLVLTQQVYCLVCTW